MVAVCLRLVAALSAATLLSFPTFARSSAPPADEKDFYRAYYLEHEAGDAEAAHALYARVAADRSVDAALRAKAERFAAALAEDLAAADLRRLVPRDAILYAELSRPGEQLSLLLDQLGLLGRVQETGGFGVSPLLVDSLLGMRGAAVAVTELGPGGQPGGVLLLHPGDLDVVRGLIETALPAAGQAVEPIGGFGTWSVEGEVFVTLTERLVVASPDRGQIEGVLARVQGRGGPSLADNEALASVLRRNEGLFSFCLNAEPVLPMIQGMLAQEAANDPELAMMMGFLDIQSLRSVSGHLGVDAEGVDLELALELAEGHRNLAFNLLRMPQVERDTLAGIPAGAAFFVALGLNPEGGVAPIQRDAAGQPVVSFMDFGRELFGNLVDVTVVGMPPGHSGTSPIPDVAVQLRVNDVERSHALWRFALGTAGGASGGGPAQAVQLAGHAVERHTLGGVPVYLAAGQGRVVLSPSKSAMERALEGPARSILEDPVYATDIQRVQAGHTVVAMANPGRCIDFAAGLMGRPDPQMESIGQLLQETVVTIGIEHTDTRLALKARVSNVPDVSGLVAEAIGASQGGRSYDVARLEPAAAPAALAPTNVGAGDLTALRSEFERLAAQGHHEDAKKPLYKVVELAKEDSMYLNNLAWVLLTEDEYGGRYLGEATKISERSNELAEYKNWYALDTLALARFLGGQTQEAVRLQRSALNLAGNDPQAGEVRKALERYEAALKEVGSAAAGEGGSGTQ